MLVELNDEEIVLLLGMAQVSLGNAKLDEKSYFVPDDAEYKLLCELGGKLRGLPPEPKEMGEPWDEELWNADPNCKHRVICPPGGGVRCLKCSGWYCY